MANKKVVLLSLLMLAGCNTIALRNNMGACNSRPVPHTVVKFDARADVDVMAGVRARVATIERFIEAFITAAAADQAFEIKHFAACIGLIANQISIAVASIVPANARVDPVHAAEFRVSVHRARVIAGQVRNFTIDRKAVACVLLAAITASRNFFAERFTIFSLIHLGRSLVDAGFHIIAQGNAILSLINAVELLATAAESLLDAHAVDALAAVACRVACVAFDYSNHLLRMLSGNVDPSRAQHRMHARAAVSPADCKISL